MRTRAKIRTGVRFTIYKDWILFSALPPTVASFTDRFRYATILYAGFVCSGPGRHRGVCVSSHGFGRDSGNGMVSKTPSSSFDTHVRTKPSGQMSESASGSTYVSLDLPANRRDKTRTRAITDAMTVIRFIKLTRQFFSRGFPA